MRKGATLIALITCLIIWIGNLTAQDNYPEDSIRSLVSGMPVSERLAYLDKRMYENVSNYDRLIYARLIYEESLRQQNDSTEANAIFMMAKHFYLINNDSMRYWIKKAEPLYRKIGRYEDLCRIKAWDIYAMGSEGKREEVLYAIEDLRTLSRELPFPEGMEMADMALANFYFSQEMPEEAEETYLDVLRRMEERDAPVVKIYNVVRHLYNGVRGAARLTYLKKAEDILRDCKERGITHLDEENPVSGLEYALQRNYAREYLEEKNAEKAWEHLQRTVQIEEEYKISRYQTVDFYHMRYYILTEDYGKALNYAGSLEEFLRERNRIPDLNEILRQKALILDKLERYHDAYMVMQEVISLRDTINNSDFNKVLAELRTTHEVDKLKIESLNMEIKEQQSRLKLFFLYVCGLVLILVLLVLAYMVYVNNKKEKEIKAGKEKAEEIDSLKTIFLSRINNEIRNPLNDIMDFSDILIDEGNHEARLRYAKIVEENNEMLQLLIANVLDISKIESKLMVLFPSDQDISVILNDIYVEMKPLVSENIDFVLDTCPELQMRVDKNRLAQIIMNLLRNAIRFTKQGSIHFGYTIEKEQVRFYIKDTGIGIPEDLQQIIFDRFARMAQEKKTGLGLAIAKGLTDLMGGEIGVESVPDKGSIFFFTVPLV